MNKKNLIVCYLILIISFSNIARSQSDDLPVYEEVQFSQQRGFFDNSFSLELAAGSDKAVIHYTIDGSQPSLTNGMVYSGPIAISNTTPVSAIAFLDGYNPSPIVVHTFIFLDSVLVQPKQRAGYEPFFFKNRYLDYEMDPEIVNNPAYKDIMKDALLSVPTISIVMDKDDIFSSSGYYPNGRHNENKQFEYICSMEYFDSNDPGNTYQATCALRPHSDKAMKRSVKLLFKSDYGPAKMKFPILKTAVHHSNSATDRFDKIIIRGGYNRNYCGSMQSDQRRNVFIRDQWIRDSQLELSGYGARGIYAHLYLNGLYWGLYNPVERPDESFTSEYFGSEKEDWFAANHAGDITMTPGTADDRWDYLINTLAKKDMSVASNYTTIKEYLNLQSFCDYVLLYFYSGGGDWQDRNGPKNFYVGHRNNPPSPLIFMAWDIEFSWFDSSKEPLSRPGFSNDNAWIKPQFLTASEGSSFPFDYNKHKHIAQPFRSLIKNSDFRMIFADRLYKHCFNNGPLSDSNSIGRWEALANYIENAMVPETARWGDMLTPDAFTGVDLFTRDGFWYWARDEVIQLMTGNSVRLRNICRTTTMNGHKLYPPIDPPVFEFDQQNDQSLDKLILTNPNNVGTIYYTLDGSDSRLPGGALSGNAVTYVDSIAIFQSVLLNTRIKNGDDWSALHDTVFYVPADLSAIKITEIMYHPPDQRNCEFIELKNTGSNADLTGLEFTDGIQYTIPAGTQLNSGEFYLLVEDSVAFKETYPGVKTDGQYSNKLSNGGEQVTLSDHFGNVIFTVNYDDEYPWPSEPDGLGYSLIPKNPDPVGNQNNPSMWIKSTIPGGSPGKNDGDLNRIKINPNEKPEFWLAPNYPNPFNPVTNIEYRLPSKAEVSIVVYNMLGKSIRTIINKIQDAGNYHVSWNGTDNKNARVASGIYFYSIIAKGTGAAYKQTRKMIILK